jgi:2TM domain-containing protein/uncharacterized protein DUF1707
MAQRPPVSDSQREEVVESLAEHTVAGDISEAERAARTRAALEATSQGELADATRGLTAGVRPPLFARLADRIPLRRHVALFLLVSAVLLVVWAVTREPSAEAGDESAGFFWPFWVMLGWGILLTAHALYSLRRPAFQRRRRPPRRRYRT